MRLLFLLACLTLTSPLFSQYAISEIPAELKEDVDAVIRNQEIVITLDDFNDMTLYVKEVVTVFNRNGLSAVRPAVGYDKSTSVKDLAAKVYDEKGKVLKKFKKRDFTDVSATDGNLYTDNRKMYLDYSPSGFPFTFEFVSELETSSTAFLPRWDPSPYYDVSTQKSSYTVINEKQVPLVSRKYNLEQFEVSVKETPGKYKYELKNMAAVERENLGPHYTEFTPVVKVALQKFQLENQSAYVKSWKDFGLWQKDKLLSGRDRIPSGTKAKINQLVANVEDPKEKARLIYEFMQNKTRYISVQVGIGGWQPSPANEVDELSYGDCKGLTNYTKALLKSQGIDSYYTIVDAGEDGRDLDEDFVALQGNHVILTVPFEDETVFLECTSQQLPFNYLGDFTDDRKVLMVTGEGGVIARTHTYKTEDNIQVLQAKVTVSDDFTVSGTLSETSEGILYGNKYFLESATNDDVLMYFKNIWGHLNNLSLANINFTNDKKRIAFTEDLNFETKNYISTAGDRILLNPNVFTRYSYLPAAEDDRTLPLKIRRGATYRDTVEILLPEAYQVEAAFEPIHIISKFGTYKARVDKLDGSKISYSRELVLNSGTFPKEEYNNYVKFIQQVVKKDKSKIVLTK
tara:strand:- start:1497 stop:3383 length:1887 start_codon:yes stop_codon:yes gene_type:complete